MRIPKRKLSQRIINASFAFVLALSTVTASMPFVFSQTASAASNGPLTVNSECNNGQVRLKFEFHEDLAASNEYQVRYHAGAYGNSGNLHWLNNHDVDVWHVDTGLVSTSGINVSAKTYGVLGDLFGLLSPKNTYSVTTDPKNCDETAPEAIVSYAANTPTNSSVVATITANEEIQNVNGWIRVNDTTIQKLYDVNTIEQVTITDAAGNTTSVNIEIDWIDKEKPTILINPTAPGFVSGTTNINVGITDNQPLDSNMNKAVWVEFYGRYDQTKKAGQKVNLSSGSGVFAINTKNLPDGEYTMRVGSVSDAVGNTSGDKTFKYFTVDNTSPAISVHGSSPDQGDTLSGVRYTREGQADQQRNRFIFKVTDASGVKKVAMYVFKDGVKVKEYALTQHGTHQEQWYADVDTTQFENGKYYISARAVDNVNNVKYFNNRLDSYHVYFDNTAPTITVKDGYVGDKDNRIFSNVSFALYDAYKVDKYIINGHESDFTDNKWSDANFNNIKSKLVQGLNTFTLYDVAGNSATYEFTYDSAQPDAPALSAEGLNSGDYTNQLSITAIWNKPGDDTVKYEYQYWNDIDGNQWKELNPWATTVFGESRTGDFTEGEGTHYLRVRAIDQAGNKSDWSNTFVVTYDKSGPEVEFNSFDATGNVFTPVLTIADPSGIKSYEWSTLVPDTDVTISDTTVSHPTFTVHNDGTYAFTLKVTDSAGNVTEKNLSFTYTAPVAPLDNGDETPVENDNDGFTDVTFDNVDNGDQGEEGTGTPEEEVAGESDSAEQDVLGTSTDKDGTWNVFGLAWYWWIAILAALAVLARLLVSVWKRRNGEA